MINESKALRLRILFIASIVTLAAVAVLIRAYQLQIIDRGRLYREAIWQFKKQMKLAPKRGIIFDRNRTPLAISLDVHSIYADPIKVKDKQKTAKILSKLTGVSQKTILRRLNSKRRFVWIKRKVSEDVAKAVREKRLEGIEMVKESKRFYPNGELLAQVLGFTNIDSEGLAGIELKYDYLLSGYQYKLSVMRDGRGRRYILDENILPDSSRGANLILTIDRNIQYIVEEEVKKIYQKYTPKGIIAVVSNPKNGKILALANYPTFDPNEYQNYNTSTFKNRAVTDVFEPGSTMKVFLMAAALNEGVVDEDEKIDCEGGVVKIDGVTIHDSHPFGKLSIDEILIHSSNIGSGKIAARLGKEVYYRYLREFGFGQKTGIELPAESRGLLRPPNRWYRVDLFNHAFGQGLSVTAIQLIAALNTIANRGVYLAPTIVESAEFPGGTMMPARNQKKKRVVSEEVAVKVTKMMEGVVSNIGTGKYAKVRGYRVAGKTGTAQKLDPETGKYSKKRWTSLFMGFVPADHPVLSAVIVVDEPEGEYYGGKVAAPAFAAIMDRILKYINVVPLDSVEKVKVTRNEESQIIKRDRRIFPLYFSGSKSNKTTNRIPNFVGLGLKDALRVSLRMGLKLDVSGSGVCVSQWPKPGSRIPSGRKVRLVLEDYFDD